MKLLRLLLRGLEPKIFRSRESVALPLSYPLSSVRLYSRLMIMISSKKSNDATNCAHVVAVNTNATKTVFENQRKTLLQIHKAKYENGTQIHIVHRTKPVPSYFRRGEK